MDLKRKAMDGAIVPFKRPRQDLVVVGSGTGGQLIQSVSIVMFLLVIPIFDSCL